MSGHGDVFDKYLHASPGNVGYYEKFMRGESLKANWISPTAHAVHYLVRNGALMNIIAVVERDDWQIESWTAQGTTAEPPYLSRRAHRARPVR